MKCFVGEIVQAFLLEMCSRTSGEIAYIMKDGGIYKEMIWQEYREHMEVYDLDSFGWVRRKAMR